MSAPTACRTCGRIGLAVMLLSLGGCYQASRSSVAVMARGLWAKEKSESRRFESGRLTLADAIARAKAQSSEVVARKAELAARKADVDAAASIDNPELRIGQMRLDQLNHDEPEVEVKVRVKPPRPIENDARKAEAEAAVRSAAGELSEAERETVAAARLAYYEAASLAQSLQATKQVASLLAKRGELLEESAAQSRATSLEVALAAIDKAKVGAELGELQGERKRALGRLGDAIGLTLPDDVELDAVDLSALAALRLPTEAVLIEGALREAPELEKRAAEIDAASALADQERTGQIPWFSFLELGYQFSEKTIDPEGFTFGAGIDLPIFDTRAAAIDAAEANKTALTRRFDADAKMIRNLVRDALRELTAAQQALGRDRAAVREATKNAVLEAQRSLAANKLDELSALKIELDAARLGLDDSKALRRLLVALAELERLTGFQPEL